MPASFLVHHPPMDLCFVENERRLAEQVPDTNP